MVSLLSFRGQVIFQTFRADPRYLFLFQILHWKSKKTIQSFSPFSVFIKVLNHYPVPPTPHPPLCAGTCFLSLMLLYPYHRDAQQYIYASCSGVHNESTFLLLLGSERKHLVYGKATSQVTTSLGCGGGGGARDVSQNTRASCLSLSQ